MNDLIAILRARSQERQARDEERRTRLKEFEALLREAGGEKAVHGSSQSCTLQEYGDSDYYYGHLTFDGTLLIAYSITEDDIIEQDDQYGGNFHIMDLDRCDPVWLRVLAVPAVMDSLATSLITSFETEIAASVRGVRSVEAMANLPFRELEVGIIDVAMKLGYGKVPSALARNDHTLLGKSDPAPQTGEQDSRQERPKRNSRKSNVSDRSGRKTRYS